MLGLKWNHISKIGIIQNRILGVFNDDVQRFRIDENNFTDLPKSVYFKISHKEIMPYC